MDVNEDRRRLSDVAADVIRPFNQTELKSATADLKEWMAETPELAPMFDANPDLKSFFLSAMTLSPHLRDTARLEVSFLPAAFSEPLAGMIRSLVDDARGSWKADEDGALPSEAEIMTRLRVAKRRVAFLLALADLGRVFSTAEVTAWLSALADAAVSATIDYLLASAAADGRLTLKDAAEPSKSSGLVVLGMGKLGAGELNYSSDIDIVVFFDPASGLVADPDDAIDLFPRLMRRLVRILQERTADGYVFRIDLRLRPDPGSTPLAIPVEAALLYYESRGQNWERAAFIKARPCAGDLEAGAAFVKELRPFVFRKYLDYAAISDIHSIKRQIHVHKGHGEIAVKGHNVKLGRGGIREIEFFVQTQQLIAGGRMPELRIRPTQEALDALAEAQWIGASTRDEMTAAYWFLREVEHRIQMVRDEQSHVLPDSETELKRIAFMCGFEDTKAFSQKLTSVLKRVEHRYARLFEREAELASDAGNLVFTGQQDDPATLETLRKLGFERPEAISSVIRGWHYGRYRVTQSAPARERLTALTPQLLKAFGENRRADEALLRFDQFLSGLPAGVQLFSLLASNPALLDLMVTIMASAPRLADIIASRPHVFDGMLDPALLSELPTREYLETRLEEFLSGAVVYEDVLDRLRIFAAEQRFLIGIRLLTGAISGADAGKAFTHLADLAIAAALKAVIDEMEAAHGAFPDSRVAILGMGKLGSFELTAGSDVDLILLYEYDDDSAESDGAKPLDAQRYFTRLTQRLMAALSAPTAEGVLFEVDMRLRPSGNKGPLATRFRSFVKYQEEEAWTWEHMALTRARPVCGDQRLSDEAVAVIEAIVARRRDIAALAKDVAEMRGMIDKEKPPQSLWDMKLIAGGLVDLEFIGQYLALAAGAEDIKVRTAGMTTQELLEELGSRMMSRDDLDTCLEALRLYGEVSQIVRLCIDDAFDPKEAPSGLVDLVCHAGGCPAIGQLEAEIKRCAKAVRTIFQRTLKA
jgi:[glutamine synthetase] adenylyltransferase / [glutamine synthetase]-adenylyl-L-tyrosine phosphorylase